MKRTVVSPLVVALTTIAIPLAAQGLAEPESFGTLSTDVTVVGTADFLPDTTLGGTGYFTEVNGERWMYNTLGSFTLVAPLGEVPTGARILGVAFYGRDDASGEGIDLEGSLVEHWRRWDDGSTIGSTELGSCSTADAPGPTVCSFALDHTVRPRADWDGDTHKDVASYVLKAVVSGSSAVTLGMVAVLWQRQLHPAPATATFTDVPIGHPLFQYVEALAASGITVGCGGGEYCVDQPVSRGQMAVFLAKALGLHWDWDNQ